MPSHRTKTRAPAPNRRPQTVATHASRTPDSPAPPISPPIMPASVYTFRDLDHLIRTARGQDQHAYYRRYGHLNSRQLEECMRQLEGAEASVATSSGMTALVALCWANLEPGDHVIAAQDLYGGSTSFLTEHFPRLGLEASLVEFELESIRRALRPNTRMIFFEMISNPLVKIADLEPILAFAKEHKLLTVVDNTFATPVLVRPLEWGADLVYHSATKFLGGHGDAVGGVLSGRAELIARTRKFAVAIGGTIAPFDAWLILRGIKTLHLRVRQACANALTIAATLARHRKIRRVYYSGLPSSPFHSRAQKYLEGGFGPMLAFEIDGDVRAFCRSLKLVELAPSLGDVTTTITHPYSTSHSYLPVSERLRLGVTPQLIRMSTGIDDPADVLDDIDQALKGA